MILASPLTAFDYIWGGRLNLNAEAPDMQGTVFSATTADSVNFFLKGSWNELLNIQVDTSLIFEGDYRYGVDLDLELGYFGKSTILYPAIRELNLYGRLDDYYYRAGRQFLRDPGMLIVSHPVDGILIGSRIGSGSLDFQAGYTGLVNENASNLNLSVNDLAGSHTGDFTAPRLIEKVTWALPGFYQQNLTLSLLAQQDLHQSGDLLDDTEKMNSQYLEAVLKGFLLPALSYSLTAVGETGSYGDASIMAAVGRGEATFYPGRNSALGVDIIYSTGDSWDRVDYYASGAAADFDEMKQYVPISSVSGQGYVEVFELGNITTLGVFGSFSPSPSLRTELRATTILRTTPGPVSSTLVLNDGNDDSFIGQEGLLSIIMKPASDLSIGFRTGVLYLGDTITINEELEKYFPVLFRVGLDLSLSF